MTSDIQIEGSRRRFLRIVGGASVATGGLALLSACKDDIRDATSVPAPTATSTAPVSVPPTYTATDTDRLNFALQMHYLVANFLKISLDGTALTNDLTSGSGMLGKVAGGRQVSFADATLTNLVREVTTATVARVGFLRRKLGNAVTAQPAINLATGQGSAFQAFSVPTSSTPPTSLFDPFASENDFLLGATALSAVLSSAMAELAWQMNTDVRQYFAPLTAGIAATDSALRNFLYTRAANEVTPLPTGQVSLFSRASSMSSARNPFDGPGSRDQGLGSKTGPNIGITDGANWVAIRRSPEQALGVFYTSVLSVSSGGFFPAGVNGTIKVSGANS